jgi:hypothetical protein
LHAARGQQTTVGVIELADLLVDHAANRLGELALRLRKLADYHPAPLVLGEHTTIAQEAHEVRHEERIAFGPFMESTRQLRGKEMLGKLQTEVAIDILARQKIDRDVAAYAVSLQLQPDALKRMIGSDQLSRTVRGHDQNST